MSTATKSGITAAHNGVVVISVPLPPYSPQRRRHRIPSNHGVIEPIMCEPFVAFDARIPQRGILVATEREHRLVHLLGIKHLEAYEKVEILYRQTRDSQKQVRLQLRDHVLQRVIAKIGKVHEYVDARRELDQLFLYELEILLVCIMLITVLSLL